MIRVPAPMSVSMRWGLGLLRLNMLRTFNLSAWTCQG